MAEVSEEVSKTAWQDKTRSAGCFGEEREVFLRSHLEFTYYCISLYTSILVWTYGFGDNMLFCCVLLNGTCKV